jgi:hypothetical protein
METNMANLGRGVTDLKLTPSDIPLAGDDLARFETSFEHTKEVWGELLEENGNRLQKGNLSLHWMNTEGSAWNKSRVKPSSRGLTLMDINRPDVYGTVPKIAPHRKFASRGSIRDQYLNRMPDVSDYTIMDRDEVWADNVETLYEEAVARQWKATTDVPWDEYEDIVKLPEDIRLASAQVATFLTEVEFVAADMPAKWLYHIPQDFLEVKMFMVTQMMDEARHQEVFRKRAIIGGGLLHASPGFEWALKVILEAPNHTMGSFMLNLLAEGMVLTIFRSGEMIAPTQLDKEIFRLTLQDEARHVSYGVMQVKNYLDKHPDRAAATEELHRFADIAEQVMLTTLTEPTVIEPLAVLLGGGIKYAETKGLDGVAKLWDMLISEYLQRCDRVGLDRHARCTLPRTAPWAA